MQVNLSHFFNINDTVAVALSGGKDSMALLHYLLSKKDLLKINVIALNVEHGIRGQESINDSQFVKDYCKEKNVPILTYTVNSLEKAKSEKLSVEQSARALRYQCFYDAISSGKCDKVATAHHSLDNLESTLFNLFRGTGLKGASGIEENFSNSIVRPFLTVEKEEIENYIKENNIPYVTDKTNFDQDYTRNYIRLNILPHVKKIFPEATKSVLRLNEIVLVESEYLDEQAKRSMLFNCDSVSIQIPIHKALFGRAVIIALKHLGVKKDWEKVHVDSAYALISNKNGSKATLLNGITAIREYDKITFYIEQPDCALNIPFALGEYTISDRKINIKQVPFPKDLKSGFYCDYDKIPNGAVIRFRQPADTFTKFGGGTKNLNDYFTDIKIPQRMRNFIPLLAFNNTILAIFGVAISDQVKVEKSTKNIIKLY